MKLTKEKLKQLIKEEILEEFEEEEFEEEFEEEPEEDYTEKYEDALSKIHDCEKRVEYLKKRLEKCEEADRNRIGKRTGNWSDLWENN